MWQSLLHSTPGVTKRGKKNYDVGQVHKNVFFFYKVGRFIAASGWYFKVSQLLQCWLSTMFKLLIFMTLFLRHPQLCAREVIFC